MPKLAFGVRTMKVIIVLSFVLLLNASSVLAQSQNSSKNSGTGVTLSIKIDGSWQQGNQQKLLTLVLRNESRNQIKTKDTGRTERDYTVELKDSKGEIVSYSEKGERIIKGLKEASVIYVPIKSGEEIVLSLNLAELYSLDDNETYRVSVFKSVYIQSNKTYQKVRSNEIKTRKSSKN